MGLREVIFDILREKGEIDIARVSKIIDVSYNKLSRQFINMEAEGIIEKYSKGNPPIDCYRIKR